MKFKYCMKLVEIFIEATHVEYCFKTLHWAIWTRIMNKSPDPNTSDSSRFALVSLSRGKLARTSRRRDYLRSSVRWRGRSTTVRRMKRRLSKTLTDEGCRRSRCSLCCIEVISGDPRSSAYWNFILLHCISTRPQVCFVVVS